MSKPLTYGPTIGVRLPLDLYNAVAEMAGPDGPGPWIRDLVVDYIPTCAGVSPMSIPATQYDLDGLRALLNAQATIINGILDLIEGSCERSHDD